MWSGLSPANKRESINEALKFNYTMAAWAATIIRRVEFPEEGIGQEGGMPSWLRLTAVGMVRTFLSKESFALQETGSNLKPWQELAADESSVSKPSVSLQRYSPPCPV